MKCNYRVLISWEVGPCDEHSITSYVGYNGLSEDYTRTIYNTLERARALLETDNRTRYPDGRYPVGGFTVYLERREREGAEWEDATPQEAYIQ